VKFKLFLECALEDGADLIATGHYAKTDSASLFKARDANKDQTYFLCRVSSEALGKTLFPIGDMLKSEVKAKAKRYGLVTAARRESMGICFVGTVGIREFLSQYVVTKPGNIVDKQTGKIVGTHDGAIFYTLGQRHGLNVGGGLPYYVVGKDMKKNVVYVSRDLNTPEFWREELEIVDTFWRDKPEANKIYQVRLRHRAPLVDATISGNTIILKRPERAIAPGQSAVFYDDEVCIGGGIVAN
jgi:tRNA-specific 2-thiouridylase